MTATRPPFTPWDDRELPALLEPEEATRRAATLGWIDEQLTDLLKRWAAETDSEAAAAILAKHATNFAWHTSLWKNEILGGEASAEPGDAKTIVDAVAATKVTDLVEALTAVYRVLIPRIIAARTYHQRALNERADAATHRWMPFMLQDAFEAVRDGELLLQTLLSNKEAVERSAKTRAALESTIVKAGGLIGPNTLGDFSETVKEVPVR